MVLLDGFEKFFDAATTHAPSLQYAQYYSDLEQVYRPGRLRQLMVKDFHTHAINTGLWASRAGLFTMQRVRDLADEAIAIASEFCPTLEQPFLNYCLDMTRVEMRPFSVTGQECAWPGDSRPLRTEFYCATSTAGSSGESASTTRTSPGTRPRRKRAPRGVWIYLVNRLRTRQVSGD
jgi:hypothetical protein